MAVPYKIILFFVSFVQVALTYEDDHLIAASTLCRHSEQNIVDTYPTDPWKNREFWPNGYGQLTNIGKQSQFKLEEYFRERYAIIIPNGRYSPNTVRVRSTDLDITLMSAQVNLAALFPPYGNQLWNPSLKWVPIPIHTLPLSQDNLLNQFRRCDRAEYLVAEHLEKTNYDGLDNYAPLIRYIEANSGRNYSTFISLLQLYDTLLTEQLSGKCLPEWAELLMEPGCDLYYIAARYYQIRTINNDLKKLESGYLLKEILNQFIDKIQMNANSINLTMYFAHDNTIASMMDSLGLFEPPFHPPFSSCILFELRQSKDIPYVQLFFKPNPAADEEPLYISKCDGFQCPLPTMFQVYNDILPNKSYDDECQLREGEVLPPDGNPESMRFQYYE